MALTTSIVAGATLASGALQAKAASKASKTQARSALDAVAEQSRQYDQTREDYAPWRAAGVSALARLEDPQKNFLASPGYDWARSEGMRGIERTAAARGGAASGNALRALSQFNAGLASQEYSNWFSQQSSLAGMGQSVTNSLAQLGANKANYTGNALMAAGDARASGIVGRANSLSNMLGQGADTYLTFKDRPWLLN